ncbi:MAG: hypothetical protein K8S55_02135, partial [Phycisphaerae bacterium]|nr:hypothetical protein [Phycisphaerae bacterium]
AQPKGVLPILPGQRRRQTRHPGTAAKIDLRNLKFARVLGGKNVAKITNVGWHGDTAGVAMMNGA